MSRIPEPDQKVAGTARSSTASGRKVPMTSRTRAAKPHLRLLHSTLTLQVDAIRERERRSLAHELHDGPARRLVQCIHHLELCERLLGPGQEAAAAELQAAQGTLRQSMEEMRRLVSHYRSMVKEGDLKAHLLATIVEFHRLCSADITLDFPSTPLNLHPQQVEALHAVVREALFNAWRHGSPAAISISVQSYPGEVKVSISDNGRGFDTSQKNRTGERGYKVGLLGLRERVNECGGELVIESQPGSGATVTARFQVKMRPVYEVSARVSA